MVREKILFINDELEFVSNTGDKINDFFYITQKNHLVSFDLINFIFVFNKPPYQTIPLPKPTHMSFARGLTLWYSDQDWQELKNTFLDFSSLREGDIIFQNSDHLK